MPPFHIDGFLAARLSSPTLNATNTARLIADAPKQAHDAAASTTSIISSSPSGVVMPSSQFIGVGTSGAGKGVAIGVAGSIVAIFLIVMVIALTVHLGAGKGRYNRNNNKKKNKENQGFRGADTIQLRPYRRPQQGGRDNGLPLSVNQAQATPRPTAAGGWKSALDGKLARSADAVRSWRA